MTDMHFERRWTWRDRLRNRLFPESLPPEIPAGIPAEVLIHGDVIHTDIEIRVSFIDRLRLLASGRLCVKARTGAREPVNTVWSNSVAFVVWRFHREQPVAAGTTEPRA